MLLEFIDFRADVHANNAVNQSYAFVIIDK